MNLKEGWENRKMMSKVELRLNALIDVFKNKDELDYIVYASKLYGGKHVMEELDNRYKNKLMS